MSEKTARLPLSELKDLRFIVASAWDYEKRFGTGVLGVLERYSLAFDRLNKKIQELEGKPFSCPHTQDAFNEGKRV